MATSKVSILSNALALIGHKPIISLDNADAITTAADQAFDLLLPSVLSSNNWRFAANIQPLVQLWEVPPAPWGAVYQLPSGFLKLLRLYPNIYEFDIYNNSKLYTILNQFNGSFCNGGNYTPPSPQPPPTPCCPQQNQPFSIEYIFMPDVSQLPPHFVNYFVYEIAKYLSLSNAQRPDFYAALNAACQYQFAMAAAIEAQNRPQYSQVLFPVLVNRSIGGFIGNSSGAG